MDCQFKIVKQQRDGTTVVECAGGITRIGSKSGKFRRTCDCHLAGPGIQQPAECVHRGREERRRVACESCCGRTEIKVFACAIHGECTIQTELPGVECCAACGDYSPQPPPPEVPRDQQG